MRILLRLLGILVVLVVILGVAGMFLPRSVSVDRQVVINATADKIFPYVNSMQQTQAWSPWLGIDPNVKTTFDGPESGVGNKLTWASDNAQVGSGTQIITASQPNQRVETDLDFGDMGTAKARFELSPSGDGTQVIWGFTTDMGANPYMRYMGLMMDGWVGGDYEQGLANLKAVVEGS